MTAIKGGLPTEIASAARAALAGARRLGFDSVNVARWFGVPLWTDARYVTAPSADERARRGAGAWIALFVAGEAIPARAIAGAEALEAAELVERDGENLRARVALTPLDGSWIASDRFDAVGDEVVGAPDLSALNVCASLPRAVVDGGRVLDVGCGAGAIALCAARRGARVLGGDVDLRALEFARSSAALSGAGEVEFVASDLFSAATGDRFDLVTFNAPLLRAAIASSDPHAPARYAQSPRGEALALDFLAALEAHLTDGGEALLHAQLTPAVERALDEIAARRRVVSLRFATALDGTPHALTAITPGRGRRSPSVPLGPLCPHLARAHFDALSADPLATPDATPVPAPWLELRESRQLGGPWRAASFGGVLLDEPLRALLDRLDGRPLAALALDDDDRARLDRLLALGLVFLR